jgi:hypothetical protein
MHTYMGLFKHSCVHTWDLVVTGAYKSCTSQYRGSFNSQGRSVGPSSGLTESRQKKNSVGWLAEQWQEARIPSRRSRIGGEGLPSRDLSHIRAHRSKRRIFFSCA